MTCGLKYCVVDEFETRRQKCSVDDFTIDDLTWGGDYAHSNLFFDDKLLGGVQLFDAAVEHDLDPQLVLGLAFRQPVRPEMNRTRQFVGGRVPVLAMTGI